MALRKVLMPLLVYLQLIFFAESAALMATLRQSEGRNAATLLPQSDSGWIRGKSPLVAVTKVTDATTALVLLPVAMAPTPLLQLVHIPVAINRFV